MPEIAARKFTVSRIFDDVLNQSMIHVVDELYERNVTVSGIPGGIGICTNGLELIKKICC